MKDINPLNQLVDDLNQLLMQETEVLRRLDHSSLEALTDRKMELLGELSKMSRQGADQATLHAILKLRERALSNQMLMVHARDLTQGVFDRLTGKDQGLRAQGGRLLEVRG